MDPDDFSMFITARQGPIQEALDGSDPINKDMNDFASWVKNKKLGAARLHVQPYLAKVLNNEKARTEFLKPNKNLKDVIKHLPVESSKDRRIEDASIDELCDYLSNKIEEHTNNKEFDYFKSDAGEQTFNNVFLLSDQLLEFLEDIENSSS
jgi:hypothetical protein